MDLVELNVLGEFRMERSKQVLAGAATDRVRALLAFLALEGAQPRISLCTLFWPYLPQEAAFDHLRKTLYRLRQRLDESVPDAADLLLASRQNIQLDPQHMVVDVLRFQSLLAECDRHAHGTLANCDACLARLAEAVNLYKGELLAGIGLDNAPAFMEWLLLRRETLQHQALLALSNLATAWEARGDVTHAHAYCSRTLALDPFREETQRQMMRLLVRMGQRNQALQHYESCRRLLREELGVEPDPSTVALYEQILRADLQSLPLVPQTAPIERSVARPVAPIAPLQLPPTPIINAQSWREMPETGRIYGRELELAQLQRWLSTDRCQLVAILGIGGVGKTTLAAAAAIAADFDKVIWRSLLNAPPLDELLRGILLNIAQQPLAGLPLSLDEQLAWLLRELRRQRCLLVLDNLESILHPEGMGQMRAGYEGYTQLLRQMAENRHNSALLLTSREQPQAFARWEEDLPWIRSLRLEGLAGTAGQAILAAHGLNGQAADSAALVQCYSGHPLALKLVSETIQDLFEGDIAAFLAYDVVIFEDIRAVLEQQFERLPALEQELLLWLAVEREPVSLATLRAVVVPARSPQEVVQALRALQRRSLIQIANNSRPLDAPVAPAGSWGDAKIAAPNMIMEYLAERLIEKACQEIEQEHLHWLHKYALMQAQAVEYIRQSQVRLILQPVADRLNSLWGCDALSSKLAHILHELRNQPFPTSGYAAGNLLNLLTLLGSNVGALDLAGLSIWQADLRQTNLAGSNLAAADLKGSRFADTLSVIRTVAVSQDGALIAAGTRGGEVRLWHADNGQLIQVYRGHKGTVRSVAFSPDGTILASGGEDRTVRLWDIEGTHSSPSHRLSSHRLSSQALSHAHLLEAHTGRVISVVFHPDGKTLASGSADGTVRLWDVATGETTTVLHGHEYWVSALAISPDGRTLASGGYDCIIRLWDFQTKELRATLTGHKELVSSLAFDPLGARLASSSYDNTLCLWELAGGQMLYSIEAATDLITTVAFSHDSKFLATCGDDWLIRLWDARSGDLISVFQGHTGSVCSLVFSPDGQTIVSGGADQQLCLWDVHTTRICRLFSGRSQTINSLVFHPNGKMLASAHVDNVVRLWDIENHKVRQTLQGHSLAVNCVAFSPDGALLASASDDKSIQVWTIPAQGNARLRTVFRGHRRDVIALDFHPAGKTLASGSEDLTIGIWNVEPGQLQRLLQVDDMPMRTVQIDPAGKVLASDSQKYIRLWDLQSGLLYTTLKGHANFMWSLDYSPDGHWLASGGSDGLIGLWDVRDPAQPQHMKTWHGHADRVFMVAFHPNGRYLASGSADHTVRLWDMQSYEAIYTLTGHTHWVWSLAFSPDGSILASSGMDETIRLWDSQSGESLGVLHTPGPYAGMNISGAKGISDAERTTLKLLGAVEQ